MERDDPWDELAERFVDESHHSVRGRVRNHVIGRHLGAHLPSPPASIIDIGGGAGIQSIPLARQGYEVTIVDSSPGMLRRAAGTLRESPDEVSGRVRVIELDGERAISAAGSKTFDGVLCHGVLPYVGDPKPLVETICALSAPGGVVSIVAKNQKALAVSPALEGGWTDALVAFDATWQVNRLGLDTRADTVEELSDLLTRQGIETVGWFGVRLFTARARPDLRTESTEPADFENLLAVELEASLRDPYRQLSRLFHLTGVKSHRSSDSRD